MQQEDTQPESSHTAQAPSSFDQQSAQIDDTPPSSEPPLVTSNLAAPPRRGHPPRNPSETHMELPHGDLTEDELDRRVQAARAQQLNQKKRSYLAALERGEDPSYTPDLSEPTATRSEAEGPTKRPRSGESWSKVTFSVPKYQGKSWTELQTFLVKIESIFEAQHYEFAADSRRVIYAGTCIQGDTERRWTTFVQQSGGIANLTWEEMKQWLKDQLADPPTRAFEATQRLDSLYQRQGQSCRSFLDVWEAAEAELPGTDPELHRVCRVLHRLSPHYRERLVSSGIPATWRILRHEAVLADSFIGANKANTNSAGYPSTYQRPRRDAENAAPQLVATEVSPAHTKTYAEEATTTQRPRRELECWRCGGSHKQPDCRELPCSTCNRGNHTTAKHALYLEGKWPPPVRDGYGHTQRGNRDGPATAPNNDTVYSRRA